MSVRVLAYPDTDRKAVRKARDLIEMINHGAAAEDFRYAKAYFGKDNDWKPTEMEVVVMGSKCSKLDLAEFDAERFFSAIIILLFSPGTDGIQNGFQYVSKLRTNTELLIYAFACDPHAAGPLIHEHVIAPNDWPASAYPNTDTWKRKTAAQNGSFFHYELGSYHGAPTSLPVIPAQARIATKKWVNLERLKEHPAWTHIPGLAPYASDTRLVLCVSAIVEEPDTGLRAETFVADSFDPNTGLFEQIDTISSTLGQKHGQNTLRMVLLFFANVTPEQREAAEPDLEDIWLQVLELGSQDILLTAKSMIWYYNWEGAADFERFFVQHEWDRLRGTGTLPQALGVYLTALSLREKLNALASPPPFRPVQIAGYDTLRKEEKDQRAMDWCIHSGPSGTVYLRDKFATAEPVALTDEKSSRRLSWEAFTKLMITCRQFGLVGRTKDGYFAKMSALPDLPKNVLDPARHARRYDTRFATEAAEGSDDRDTEDSVWRLDIKSVKKPPFIGYTHFWMPFNTVADADRKFYGRVAKVAPFPKDLPAPSVWHSDRRWQFAYFLVSVGSAPARLASVGNITPHKDGDYRGIKDILVLSNEVVAYPNRTSLVLDIMAPSISDRDAGFSTSDMMQILKCWATNYDEITLIDQSRAAWYDKRGLVRQCSPAITAWLENDSQYSIYERWGFRPLLTEKKRLKPATLYRAQMKAAPLRDGRLFFAQEEDPDNFMPDLEEAMYKVASRTPDGTVLDLAKHIVRVYGTKQMFPEDYGQFRNAVGFIATYRMVQYSITFEEYMRDLVDLRKRARNAPEENEMVVNAPGSLDIPDGNMEPPQPKKPRLESRSRPRQPTSGEIVASPPSKPVDFIDLTEDDSEDDTLMEVDSSPAETDPSRRRKMK
jgi:hypothetical protein